MKIARQLYLEFKDDYFKHNMFPYERFGQAFVNKFIPEGTSMPDLYYSTSDRKSVEKIEAELVDWESKDIV
jgi:hypothetical protein